MKQILQSFKTGEMWLADVPAPLCKAKGAVVKTAASFVSAGTERMLAEFAKKGLIGKALQMPDQVKKVIRKMKTEGVFATLEKVQASSTSPSRSDTPARALSWRRDVTADCESQGIAGRDRKADCEMKIIHFCVGLEGWNGMANTARQFVAEKLARGDDSQLTSDVGIIERAEKVDCVQAHGTWLPVLWKVAKIAKKKGAELIVRPCGNYDPIRIRRGAIKRLRKWLVGPFEHAMLNRADFVQCTCAAEAEWVKAYHPKARIQMTDLKRFFNLGVGIGPRRTADGSIHILCIWGDMIR